MGMSEKPPLTDSEIYERLHKALEPLTGVEGETALGKNSLNAARLVLTGLQISLLKRSEDLKDPDEPLSPQPSDQQ